jgi:hypothetical protein
VPGWFEFWAATLVIWPCRVQIPTWLALAESKQTNNFIFLAITRKFALYFQSDITGHEWGEQKWLRGRTAEGAEEVGRSAGNGAYQPLAPRSCRLRWGHSQRQKLARWPRCVTIVQQFIFSWLFLCYCFLFCGKCRMHIPQNAQERIRWHDGGQLRSTDEVCYRWSKI